MKHTERDSRLFAVNMQPTFITSPLLRLKSEGGWNTPKYKEHEGSWWSVWFLWVWLNGALGLPFFETHSPRPRHFLVISVKHVGSLTGKASSRTRGSSRREVKCKLFEWHVTKILQLFVKFSVVSNDLWQRTKIFTKVYKNLLTICFTSGFWQLVLQNPWSRIKSLPFIDTCIRAWQKLNRISKRYRSILFSSAN